MTEFIEFEIDLHTLANKLVGDGNADRLFSLLNYVALEIQQQHYGRQLTVKNRFGVFAQRSQERLDENAVMLLNVMMEEQP